MWADPERVSARQASKPGSERSAAASTTPRTQRKCRAGANQRRAAGTWPPGTACPPMRRCSRRRTPRPGRAGTRRCGCWPRLREQAGVTPARARLTAVGLRSAGAARRCVRQRRLLAIFCCINCLNYLDRGAIASTGVLGHSPRQSKARLVASHRTAARRRAAADTVSCSVVLACRHLCGRSPAPPADGAGCTGRRRPSRLRL
eukprot:scaffold3297_cov327-Prasinococcus_capsulatus_cf.AAC.2